MNAILFGFKCCGKTHFGKLLAAKLRVPFADTDQIMVQLYAQRTGRALTPRTLYQKLGESEFRLLETDAILSLKDMQNGVIAVGGGAILLPQNRQQLQNIGTLIYLETSLETIKKRVSDHLVGPIETLYQERLPFYRAIPASCIHTDLLDEAGVVAALCSIMEKTYAF